MRVERSEVDRTRTENRRAKMKKGEKASVADSKKKKKEKNGRG